MQVVSTPPRKKSWQTGRERVSVLAQMAFQRDYFVRRLVALREQAGLTQEQAAHRIGVTYRQLQRWEAGESAPYPQNMARIAAAFGKTIDFFYEDDTPPPPPELATSADIARLEQRIEELQTEIIRLLVERQHQGQTGGRGQG